MQTPFELPYNILEDGPTSRHTRVLKPYIDRLLHIDTSHPVHSNPYNRFNVLRDDVREETLEYWMSDDDDDDDGDNDISGKETRRHSDLDSESDSEEDSTSANQNKKRKVLIPRMHDTQIIEFNENPSTYIMDSQEVVHLKQQMFLSLQHRASKRKQKNSHSTIPQEIATKDISHALTLLTGNEVKYKPVYFMPNAKYSRVSFLKYLSRVLDTLFYISLFKGNWEQCFRLFSILVKIFDADIHQIWTLGVHILCELNLVEFKHFFYRQWIKDSTDDDNDEVPELPKSVLSDLSFLQNPSLVPLIYPKSMKDVHLKKVLQRTVATKRPTQDTILKFLRLLMRTSRNQHPLIGSYPEQNYIPGGILIPEKEINNTGDDKEKATTTDPLVENETGSEDEKYENDGENQREENEDNEGYSESESDTSHDEIESDSELESEFESELEIVSGSNINHLKIKPQKSKSPRHIIIKNAEFDPKGNNHLPNQRTYRNALHRHSTPLHRQGTRTRTPTHTLSYLWMLVRTGRINVVQNALEPLLLVVPTSTDARVGLADLASRILDVSGIVHEIEANDDLDWEKVDLVDMKMNEILDHWRKWKHQFAKRVRKGNKRKKSKGIQQFDGYEDIEKSLHTLKKWVKKVVQMDKSKKDKFKDKNGGIKVDNSKDNYDNNSEDSDNFVTADEDEEDEEEVRREMERLMGYSEQVPDDVEEGFENGEDDEDEDEDEEEVRREMERLMGYSDGFAQRDDNQPSEYDEGYDEFPTEDEQFYNEFNQVRNDSDSE